MSTEDWDEDDGPSMDHRKAVRTQGSLLYLRAGHPIHAMDDAVMDDQPLLGQLMGYAMDAPEVIPAGGMAFHRLRPIMLTNPRE